MKASKLGLGLGVIFGSAVLLSSGVALAQGAIAPEDAKMSTVLAAQQQGDYDYLGKVCVRKSSLRHVEEKACQIWIDHLKEKKDIETLTRICETKGSPMPNAYYHAACREAEKASAGNWDSKLSNCASLPADYETQKKKHSSRAQPIFFAAVQSAIKCKNWDYLFGSLLNSNSGSKNDRWAVQALRQLKKNAQEDEFFKGLESYLKKTKAPFGSELGCNAVVHLTNWLISAKRFDKAEGFVKFMNKLTGCGRANFAKYFFAAKCAKATAFFYDQLKSNDPETKAFACRFLGEHGSKKHFGRMGTIAKTDPTFRVEKKVKIYWVRDTCKAAMGRIKLRK